MYIEKQKKKSGTYFYMVENIRRKGGWEKIRIYMGKDIGRREAEQLKKKKSADMMKKVEEARESSDSLLTLISDEQRERLSKIKEAYLKGKKRMDRRQHENYYEHFVTEFTYDTNAIEGSTITLQETGMILFDRRVPEGKSLREISEVQNHKDAFDYMLKYNGDISRNFVLKLHKLLMHNILWKYAGTFRDVRVYVRGAGFVPPEPKYVDREFKRLMLWYRANKKKYHPVVVAAYFHHVFESIHPFRDGNGRVGRLLLNFVLRKNSLPMINIKYKNRSKYYAALEAGNKGDLRPMSDLIIEYLERTEDSV